MFFLFLSLHPHGILKIIKHQMNVLAVMKLSPFDGTKH